jgi:hypothetical protein
LNAVSLTHVNTAVVALGAWCDLIPEDPLVSPGSVSFKVHEFALLAHGRRITLHTERGFSIWGPWKPTTQDPLARMTADDIERNVRTTVLPDEDPCEDEHPYAWLSELLAHHGIAVTADSLRHLPYTVELSERIRQILAARPG